jgi:hypothetical protein
MRGIELQRLSQQMPVTVHFCAHAIYYPPALVLVNKIKIISKSDVIHVKSLFRDKIKLDPFLQLHIIRIVDRQRIFPPGIFKYQDVIIHFPDDVKVYVPVILTQWLRIGYLLCKRKKW